MGTKRGPSFDQRHLMPGKGFCRRCLAHAEKYRHVEVTRPDQTKDTWVICEACYVRPDHAKWLERREVDRTKLLARTRAHEVKHDGKCQVLR